MARSGSGIVARCPTWLTVGLTISASSSVHLTGPRATDYYRATSASPARMAAWRSLAATLLATPRQQRGAAPSLAPLKLKSMMRGCARTIGVIVAIVVVLLVIGSLLPEQPATSDARRSSVDLSKPVYLAKDAVECGTLAAAFTYSRGQQAGGEAQGHRAVADLFVLSSAPARTRSRPRRHHRRSRLRKDEVRSFPARAKRRLLRASARFGKLGGKVFWAFHRTPYGSRSTISSVSARTNAPQERCGRRHSLGISASAVPTSPPRGRPRAGER